MWIPILYLLRGLPDLNSQMRRIDLCCKLGGPLLISLLTGISTNVAILTTLDMHVLCVFIEYFAIANVYNNVPAPPNLNVSRPIQPS
ncbi:solute carrier family 40 (iron-regulated transporter), member 1 [[Emmonsia] crescens]|uniref:Solute carrier family 40 member n=1 Tax=[Emmonsia] crescens TaxID=73230 RepID=A0A2B7Z9K6_9EURO|nr:solute carrier family 40 (iron-regulated transporter), member 1 [Emmonsia crescens]